MYKTEINNMSEGGIGGAAPNKLGRREAGCRAKRDNRQRSDGSKLVYILNELSVHEIDG